MKNNNGLGSAFNAVALVAAIAGLAFLAFTSKSAAVPVNGNIKRDHLLADLEKSFANEDYNQCVTLMGHLATDYGRQKDVQDCLLAVIIASEEIFGPRETQTMINAVNKSSLAMAHNAELQRYRRALSEAFSDQSKLRNAVVREITRIMRSAGNSHTVLDRQPVADRKLVHADPKTELAPLEFICRFHQQKQAPKPSSMH